jgi:hypothetical protein
MMESHSNDGFLVSVEIRGSLWDLILAVVRANEIQKIAFCGFLQFALQISEPLEQLSVLFPEIVCIALVSVADDLCSVQVVLCVVQLGANFAQFSFNELTLAACEFKLSNRLLLRELILLH